MAKKENNPLECTMIFGSYAVDTLYDEGIDAALDAAEADGMVVHKKFNTRQEMDEYFNGIDDMDGWNKYAVIYSDGTF